MKKSSAPKKLLSLDTETLREVTGGFFPGAIGPLWASIRLFHPDRNQILLNAGVVPAKMEA